jgi:hypothetical protein
MNDHPMHLKGIPVAQGRDRLQDAGFSFIFDWDRSEVWETPGNRTAGIVAIPFADDEATEYLAVQFERALAIA